MTEPTPELLDACAHHIPTVKADAHEAWLVCSCGMQSYRSGKTWSEWWVNHMAAFVQAREQAARTEGFELAHESFSCGHARANYRDPNYKPGDADCDSSKCEFCEAEKRWQAREQAARLDAIADCADAAAQDAQVIVTSLGNMEDGDTSGEEFDRAMKAALNVTKRIRALAEPKEPR